MSSIEADGLLWGCFQWMDNTQFIRSIVVNIALNVTMLCQAMKSLYHPPKQMMSEGMMVDVVQDFPMVCDQV